MDKNNSMKKNNQEECCSALLNKTMCEVEKDPRFAEVYSRISKTEIKHADYWKKQAAEKRFFFC
ncbi:MAG: hypothetical protein CVU43_07175 [Chloroflexi bacterium HGW-Chloroflexi-5]|jgi:hypothetical protein|nr:MAG: hypothetical protein CVU43_07175 [Chloroflexi bacterium HGW-Chloroflexi-5]